MKFFGQHINKDKQMDKISGWIAHMVLNIQDKFSRMLLSFTKKWNRNQQIIFLITFSVICVGWCAWITVSSFHLHPFTFSTDNNVVQIEHQPQLQTLTAKITEEEFLKVEEYKRNHPNLSETDPGLYNGLTLIEEMYNQQKK